VLDMVYITAYLSIALAVFNIIPIPPLDGSKVLFSLMSDADYYKLMRYERYGMLLLLILIATNVLANPLQIVTRSIFKILFVFADWGYDISAMLFY
jgi:Zn-dependent protease